MIIYNSLFEYWDRPSKICLLATLLDPRLKEMSFASDEIRNDTIRECREQLHQLTQPPTEEHTTSSNSTTLSFNNMFANVIFGTQRSSSLDELDYYLDFRRTPVALRNSDPLLWWRQQQTQFPILSKLTQKYLDISATSVPCEYFFQMPAITLLYNAPI